MALHDAELIQRTLEGDESAFGFLVGQVQRICPRLSVP